MTKIWQNKFLLYFLSFDKKTDYKNYSYSDSFLDIFGEIPTQDPWNQLEQTSQPT